MRCAAIAGILVLLAACGPHTDSDPAAWYSYECEIDNVQGTFLTTRRQAQGAYKMITVYRYRDGKERTFTFPREKVSVCTERD